MSSRLTEPTSPEFQRLTGYLVALELQEDTPGMPLSESILTVATTLFRLGEPSLTRNELDGMRDYHTGRAPVELNKEEKLTDTSLATDTAAKFYPEANDYGFGFSRLEQAMIAIFGPTPEQVQHINAHLAALSEQDQRGYGANVAQAHMHDSYFDALSADDFIRNAERVGVVLPEVVKEAVREEVASAPRATYEELLAGAREVSSEHPAVREVNEQEGSIDPTVAYDNGYRIGKTFQNGWNTAHLTHDQIVSLLKAEGGQLNAATLAGLRDAYAHYVPAEVVTK